MFNYKRVEIYCFSVSFNSCHVHKQTIFFWLYLFWILSASGCEEASNILRNGTYLRNISCCDQMYKYNLSEIHCLCDYSWLGCIWGPEGNYHLQLQFGNFLNFFMRPQHDLFLQCVLEENLSRRAEHYFSEMKRVAKGELITCLVYAFCCIWFTNLNISYDMVPCTYIQIHSSSYYLLHILA